jgi:hypothetical protein
MRYVSRPKWSVITRTRIRSYDLVMLKGFREVVLRKIRPISIHGQVSWEVYFNDPEDPDGSVQMARVGPEAVVEGLEPGDRIRLEYILGTVTSVTRA